MKRFSLNSAIVKLQKMILVLLIACSTQVFAESKPADSSINFDHSIQKMLADYATRYQPLEYFSGITLSFYIPHQPIKNFYVGKTSHDTNAGNITQDTLFQIGSISKSFTAALALQLAQQNKLSLTDTIDKWLPEYPKWKTITLKQLFNMTSGLPNYSDAPLWQAYIYQHPQHIWSKKELISFAYPPAEFAPPLKSGYFYSNTGYILAALILEKAGAKNFADAVTLQLIKPAGLKNTFYSETELPAGVKDRMATGYGYNQYDDMFLVGKNINDVSLSWAGAAGGVIANSEDVIKWVQTLFTDTNHPVLNDSARNELTQLVSVNNGEKISQTTVAEPKAFGLGVAQAYDSDLMGRYWYYEGETLGFRALYFYQPCSGIIIAFIINSATNSENDHAGRLMKQVYSALIKQYPHLQCAYGNGVKSGILN